MNKQEKILTLKDDQKFNFECKMCGNCCENMLIKLSPYEILRFSKGLNMTTSNFINEYGILLKSKETGISIIALKHIRNGKCLFKQGKKCKVYKYRSLACRLFPVGRSSNGFILQKATYCKGIDISNQWLTVNEWLNGEEAYEYLEMNSIYNDFIKEIILKYDFNKIGDRILNLFYKILYDYNSASNEEQFKMENDRIKSIFCINMAGWFLDNYANKNEIDEEQFIKEYEKEGKKFIKENK